MSVSTFVFEYFDSFVLVSAFFFFLLSRKMAKERILEFYSFYGLWFGNNPKTMKTTTLEVFIFIFISHIFPATRRMFN